MPRPLKCRRVCCMPVASEFVPKNSKKSDTVILTVDEYETIRLIDKEGFSQEECAGFMGVARTTVQQIYTDARGKIASAIVDGNCLKIEGGHYQLCNGEEEECICGGCLKHKNCVARQKREQEKQKNNK